MEIQNIRRAPSCTRLARHRSQLQSNRVVLDGRDYELLLCERLHRVSAPVAARHQLDPNPVRRCGSDKPLRWIAATLNRIFLSNRSRDAYSDADGRFGVLALPPATYRVTVDAPNFKQAVRDDIRITLASVVELDLTLTIAGVDQTILVQESAPLLDLKRTGVSSVVVDEQIQGLPTNGRDFIVFSMMMAGVAGVRCQHAPTDEPLSDKHNRSCGCRSPAGGQLKQPAAQNRRV